jgi:hypothetical protein
MFSEALLNGYELITCSIFVCMRHCQKFAAKQAFQLPCQSDRKNTMDLTSLVIYHGQ